MSFGPPRERCDRCGEIKDSIICKAKCRPHVTKIEPHPEKTTAQQRIDAVNALREEKARADSLADALDTLLKTPALPCSVCDDGESRVYITRLANEMVLLRQRCEKALAAHRDARALDATRTAEDKKT